MSLKASTPAAASTVEGDGSKPKKKSKRKKVLNDFLFPELPCHPIKQEHRVKDPKSKWLLPALVARPAPTSEITFNPKLLSGSCWEALDKEWERLCVWDDTIVRNWADVARGARIQGRKIHMGRVFGIMVKKSHELSKDGPRRKFKYRVVFQAKSAIFQDLGSSPASMEASKNLYCYGCFPGHDIEQADSEQAYVQAELSSTETWVNIPEEAWPASWWTTLLV